MLDVEPIMPSPPARVTAAARAPPALPAMGALRMRGVEIQGRDSWRLGMVGGWFGGKGRLWVGKKWGWWRGCYIYIYICPCVESRSEQR
jgi:hypothetical protein